MKSLSMVRPSFQFIAWGLPVANDPAARPPTTDDPLASESSGLRDSNGFRTHQGPTAQRAMLPGEIPPIRVTSAATASAAYTAFGKGDGAGSRGGFMYMRTATRMAPAADGFARPLQRLR